ncbi:MAG: hypothetical protein PVJ39_19440 [Gammaproteobacteria bacterium]
MSNKLRKSHSRERMNTKSGYYAYWLDSPMETLWICDEKFTPELEKDWRAMMRTSIDYLIEGY